MKISYNWLKWYIPDAPEAEKLADVITYHLTEVEGVEKREDGDSIFDINILPNRAHDLLSHSGVARELSGQLGLSFVDPKKTYEDIIAKKEIQKTNLQIEIKTEQCRRYIGRIVRNIKVGPSPAWVVAHLESIGQRSINNIVDATNLVMYNCGHPCHAYDLAKVSDEKIIITNAKEGEKLPVVGRDGAIADLKETDIVIADSNKNLALAGVKGGRDSGISDVTTEIVLEVANFTPNTIRKTARRLNLLSDSAKRFENDLAPSHGDFGMLELSALISEMCPDAVFEELVDMYPVQQEVKTISFTTDYINNKLGGAITDNDIEKILQNYGFGYLHDFENKKWAVTVPQLRLDLEHAEDMVEEIGRIYGYDKITGSIPTLSFVPKVNEIYAKIYAIKTALVSEGYREVMTYSFTDKGEVELLASASDKNFLRTNLSDGIKKAYEMNKLNAPLFAVDPKDLKLFEIGNVFKDGKEMLHVCIADKKNVTEMPVEEYYAKAGIVSERSSDLLVYTLGQTISDTIPAFAGWSLFPFMTRDISVWVPEEVSSDELKNIYKEFGTELLVRSPQLLDKFTKEGKTSYAFRLVFQSYEKTLTDDEINQIMLNIVEKISKNGWTVR